MSTTHKDIVLILGHLPLNLHFAIPEGGVPTAGAGVGAQEGNGTTTTAGIALGFLALMVIIIETVIKRRETTVALVIDRAAREG